MMALRMVRERALPMHLLNGTSGPVEDFIQRESARDKKFLCLGCLMARLKGNVVTFQTVYCTSANSHSFGNGEGRPAMQDVRPAE